MRYRNLIVRLFNIVYVCLYVHIKCVSSIIPPPSALDTMTQESITCYNPHSALSDSIETRCAAEGRMGLRKGGWDREWAWPKSRGVERDCSNRSARQSTFILPPVSILETPSYLPLWRRESKTRPFSAQVTSRGHRVIGSSFSFTSNVCIHTHTQTHTEDDKSRPLLLSLIVVERSWTGRHLTRPTSAEWITLLSFVRLKTKWIKTNKQTTFWSSSRSTLAFDQCNLPS